MATSQRYLNSFEIYLHMKLEEIKNKSILILGYGKEGKATEEYLRHMVPGIRLDYADRESDSNYLAKQSGYDLVIKTPGIPKSLVTRPYTTATNIFFANCHNTVIGVTGTKGKSTTSSLIHHILTHAGRKSHLIGNIGNPALSELKDEVGKEDVFVMELSSYQLDDINFSPHISVVLNLFPEHMNYHGSIDSYFNAKKNIIKHVKPEDVFVYNPDYPLLSDWAKEMKCILLPFSSGVSFNETKLKGKHNIDNIRAAATVALHLGISLDNIAKAVATFNPLPHRLEKVGEFKGITFYDDAISTTPQSTEAALRTVPGVATIFLGGQDRGYDFSSLAGLLSQLNVANIVLFPESGFKIRETLRSYSQYNPLILETSKMEEAVLFAYQHTPPGSSCLLSTASPSYSVWKNFEEKGNEFKFYVNKHAIS